MAQRTISSATAGRDWRRRVPRALAPGESDSVTIESQTAGLMLIMRRGLRLNSAAGLSAARRALMDIGALHGLPAPKAGHPDARAAVLEDLWRELDAIEADEGPAAAPMGKG